MNLLRLRRVVVTDQKKICAPMHHHFHVGLGPRLADGYQAEVVVPRGARWTHDLADDLRALADALDLLEPSTIGDDA